jgi:H+-transporting ATPase
MASNFEKMSIEETLTQLNTSLKGLTEKEAEERIKNMDIMKLRKRKKVPS